MSDYCRMTITCAATDAPRFKNLGFHVAEREGALVTMEDHEANYAHDGNLPTEIVYEGTHSPGGCYDGGMFACDGTEYAFMCAGLDDTPVVCLRDDGTVEEDDRQRWLKYVAVRDRALALLEALRKQAPPEPVSIDLDPLKARAAETAAKDQWLAGKLQEAARSWLRSIEGELPRELSATEREQLTQAYKDGYLTIITTNTKPEIQN